MYMVFRMRKFASLVQSTEMVILSVRCPIWEGYQLKPFNLVQLKGGREKRSICNIQRMNAYNSELKLFLNPFKGVSTKYLNNYLV